VGGIIERTVDEEHGGVIGGHRYRERWQWDSVVWGSHAVDCYPGWGSCPIRVYVRDGRVVWEEQGGTLPTVEPGVPDANPLGCQVGCGWSRMLDASERVLHPLRRAGERGEGLWQRISWDEALTEVADGLIDALQDAGPESIVNMNGGNGFDGVLSGGAGAFVSTVGGVSTDSCGEVNDCSLGVWLTLAKYPDQGWDDMFHSDLIVIWHMNPLYTRVPVYHYVAEARYRGAEVVLLAPDVSPSAMHTDYYVPVKPGTDAALCLGMCRVLIDETLYDADFVRHANRPAAARAARQRPLPTAVGSGAGGTRGSVLRVRSRDGAPR